MSVQLILYPQTFNGQFNAISTNPNEFLVNGINFNGLSTAGSYDSTSPAQSAILAAQPPTVVNSWYRFRTTYSGTPALPTNTSGALALNSVVGNNQSGVYQRLSNLAIGQSYTLTVNVSTTGTGTIQLLAYNGTNFIGLNSFSATSSNGSLVFTAGSSTTTVIIRYSNTVADDIAISDASVIPTGTTPSGVYTEISDGQVIVDLYEDEDIPLTLSVDDFKNVAEKVQSYSKAFNLPATKRNNQIFDNIFEVTRSDNGIVFNPYVKTQCTLKQDGFVLFEGYLRLIDISDKEAEISYNVNLYSEAIALADVLKEKTFSMLDFSELTHTYTKTTIKNSWDDTTGLPLTNSLSTSSFAYDATIGVNNTNVLKYPFCDWGHQIIIANGSAGTLATENFPELTALEQAFRPFINIKYIIQKIFNDTPFTFTSNFFDEANFKKLFMDFNWGDGHVPMVFNNTGGLFLQSDQSLTSSFTTINFNQNTQNSPFPSVMGYSGGTFTAQTNNQIYNISCTGINFISLLGSTFQCEWLHTFTGGNTIYESTTSISFTGVYSYNANFSVVMQAGDTLTFRAKEISGTCKVDASSSFFGIPLLNYVTVTSTSDGVVSDNLLQTQRGDLKQWEFLKGIMTMFNLVAIPDKNNLNNIRIEPYGDIFLNNAESITHDWTEKIDISQIKLMPLTDLNKTTIFKFVEDEDDYAFMNYKNSVQGHLYGSKVFDASGFTILQGTEEIVAEPFAATVPKPLMSQFYDLIVPSIYSYNANDGTSEEFDNSPRIMFNNGIKSFTAGTFVSCTYYIPEQNGVSSGNEDAFLQFTHLTTIPTTSSSTDFHFGECQLIAPIGSAVTDNLFNTYWLPYFNELYNPDTRTMSLKVNLTPADITTFNMYDTVFIKNREFRVNKIEYKPNDLSTVEFILIP
tara:strand:- start:2481 stop:5213 length:2733 start_codon:yes stop_codon:yes gene_type:complete